MALIIRIQNSTNIILTPVVSERTGQVENDFTFSVTLFDPNGDPVPDVVALETEYYAARGDNFVTVPGSVLADLAAGTGYTLDILSIDAHEDDISIIGAPVIVAYRRS